MHILERQGRRVYVELRHDRLELGEELLTYWFLAFLALIWIAYFVPGAVRARRRTPLPATTRFKRALGIIAPPRPIPRPTSRRDAARDRRHETVKTPSGRWIVVPHASERVRRKTLRRAQRRRRRFLAALVLVAAATAVAALTRGETWLEVHLIADGVLVFYIAMLYETKRRQVERSTKVHVIGPPDQQDVRVLQPARAGGDGRT